MRVMTDVSAERYCTVVSETEVESLEHCAELSRRAGQNREFQEAMSGHHELIVEGRREIYQHREGLTIAQPRSIRLS